LIDSKCLIIGCGSIGERHLFNLKKLGINDIAVYDVNRKRLREISKKYQVQVYDDFKSSFGFKPDISLVCTHPFHHLKHTSESLKNGTHVFVEKPLSSSLTGVEKMLNMADSMGLKVSVGYNTRFEKGLNYLRNKLKKIPKNPLSISCQFGNHLKFWRPGTDYKNHYILKKGGGIILDDSHEYDYVRWLINDEIDSVYCQTKKSQTLRSKTDSIASMNLKFKNGTIANLLIDYIRPKFERKCHVIFENCEFRWEFNPENSTSWKNYGTGLRVTVESRFISKKTSKTKIFNEKINDMYLNELKDFIFSVKHNKKPKVDGWEGLKTLQIGLAALQSARKNTIIKL